VIDGITKACEELEVPITGGNVSFYNETLGEGIYPTPVLGIVGILADVHKTAKMEFRGVGHTIVLLRGSEPGDITDAESEFGSSEYAKEIHGVVWGYPPELDLEQEAALQKGLVEMIQAGLVESAHDCSSGGLAVALADSAFPQGIGLSVDVASSGLPAEFTLFGEDASGWYLPATRTPGRIKQIAAKHGFSVEVFGETVRGKVGSR
jgi:phosphoribosylformylglycinamidine synthase